MFKFPRLYLLAGLLALPATLLSGVAVAETSGGASQPAQIFLIDGVYYGCQKGSQAQGVDLSKCQKLPDVVVQQLAANGVKVPSLTSGGTGTSGSTGSTSGSGSGTTTGSTTGSTSGSTSGSSSGSNGKGETTEVTGDALNRVVSAPSGNLLCPVTAFTSDKQLDPSQCTATTRTDVKAVCQAISGSSLLACALPGKTYSQNPLGNFNTACPGGGTHTVSGGYDSSSGTLDLTITFSACVDGNGATHDGTAVMQGTLTLQSGSTTTYDMNETKTINSTLTFKDGGQMKRSCTITRKGSYNNKTGDFNGTVSRSGCTLSGQYRFKAGLVDNLIENATEFEPI